VSLVTDIFRRIGAMTHKESLQVLRDPSALLIAFVLPPILLFLFGFAISLDVDEVPVAVVMESDDAYSRSLADAFSATPYLQVQPARHRRLVEQGINTGKIRAFVVIPADFQTRVLHGEGDGLIQIITDASNPNTANFSAAYIQGAFAGWLAEISDGVAPASIKVQSRVWFNPELDAKRILVPGAIAIVMTLIGTMLTALVISREWERGTMEALMATPVSMTEILISKILPYFVLGMMACVGCTLMSVFLFDVPLTGSVPTLLLLSAIFLLPALGQGLMISTLAKSQFVAIQVSLVTGFLPAFLLSGFLFEIKSMPPLIQLVTQVVPARYFVSSLQTVFLAGDVWPLLLRDMASMLVIAAVFFGIILLKSSKRLD
jgi:ABC-2 type transport system permease protein